MRCITHGLPLDNVSAAETAARQVDLANLDREALSAHEVAEAASRVAVYPTVRKILVDKQRAFAARPGGAVLDGRDIGTVVCPDADVKLYRHGQRRRCARRAGCATFWRAAARPISPKSWPTSSGATSATWAAPNSPLRPAADAHLLDTIGNVYRSRVPGGPAIIDGAGREMRLSLTSAEARDRPTRTSLPAFYSAEFAATAAPGL